MYIREQNWLRILIYGEFDVLHCYFTIKSIKNFIYLKKNSIVNFGNVYHQYLTCCHWITVSVFPNRMKINITELSHSVAEFNLY